MKKIKNLEQYNNIVSTSRQSNKNEKKVYLHLLLNLHKN